MNNVQKFGYDLAVDSAKQQLLLASGVVAAVATFSKDFGSLKVGSAALVSAALLALCVSIIYGTKTLYCITATIVSVKSEADIAVPPPTDAPETVTNSKVQNRAFLIGMIFLAAFAVCRVFET